MTKNRATAIGAIAIGMWALLALFTVGTAPMPPLQLNMLCFGIGGVIGVIWLLATGEISALRGVSWRIYAFGTLGLFGYHFLYFSALRMAPAAEAGLIAYLWPLLIVLFSGLLPGEKLRAGHLLAAVLGLGGAALLVAPKLGTVSGDVLPGFGLAFLCALTWAGYSVISRRLGDVPTGAVAVFCILTALLSAGAHMALETPQWPEQVWGWLSVAALGIGPVGLAFYVWDIGMKSGDIQLLGAASYGAPLLSTIVLVGAGMAAPSWNLAGAAVLIVLGAALAAFASAKNNS